jgi:hypothetical protein
VYGHAVSAAPYYKTDPRAGDEVQRVDLTTHRSATLRQFTPGAAFDFSWR